MSDEAAQEIMDYYAKWDNHTKRRELLSRMERKMHTRERRSFSRSAHH